VLSPFLPAVLVARGAAPEEIGALLAAAMVVRLTAAPLAGILADRLGTPREVLSALLSAGGILALGYGAAAGFGALLLVSVLHAAATGPAGPLPDALAVPAAGAPGRAGFGYGLVRGAGAAAFIAASAAAGLLVARAGTPAAVLAPHAALFALAAAAALLLPRPDRLEVPSAAPAGRILPLLALPAFRRLLLAAGLISGSHAVHAGFATIRWQEAGLDPATIGLLWSLAVGAEVAVFLLAGPWLLARLGPAGVTALAAAAGALRWGVMATTAWLPAMLLVQPLHGLTFAAQHLAAMAILGRDVPPHLAATAQTVYASLGTGLVAAGLTLASGPLYRDLGAGAFLPMAALCAAAVPAALLLRR